MTRLTKPTLNGETYCIQFQCNFNGRNNKTKYTISIKFHWQNENSLTFIIILANENFLSRGHIIQIEVIDINHNFTKIIWNETKKFTLSLHKKLQREKKRRKEKRNSMSMIQTFINCSHKVHVIWDKFIIYNSSRMSIQYYQGS